MNKKLTYKIIYWLSLSLLLLPVIFNISFLVFNIRTKLFIERNEFTESINIEFIQNTIKKEYNEKIKSYVVPGLWETTFLPNIQNVYEQLGIGTMLQFELVDTKKQTYINDGIKTEYFINYYNVNDSNGKYYLIYVENKKIQNQWYIQKVNITIIKDDVYKITALKNYAFRPKSIIMFIFGYAMLSISFLAIRKIYRYDMKARAFIFTLIGLTTITLNMITGVLSFNPISLNLFCLSITKMGNIGNWNIGVSIPFYAIFILFKKKNNKNSIDNAEQSLQPDSAIVT